MSKRILNINPESIFVETINRVENEILEETNKQTDYNVKTKFKSSNARKLEAQTSSLQNTVNEDSKKETFSSEIEAIIATRKLASKVRSDAMKR